MNLINMILGTPLGYIMYFCYWLVDSYGLAIILFTLISKVILFPLSLSVQKNSIKMVKIQPLLDEVKSRYAGDKDKIAEEQLELYKKEKYSPAMGCLPTLIQIPLVLGLLSVIYNPLQHLLHLSQDVINLFTQQALQVAGAENLGYGAQLRIVDMVQNSPEAFSSLQGMVPDFDAVMQSILHLDLVFLGFDLSKVPPFALDVLIWVPILSGVSTLIMCVAQNYLNVLQREQGFWGQWGMTIFLVVFSTYFAFIVPAGVGLYWIAGNLLAIPVMVLCNWIYNPKKYIDYENRSSKPKLSKEEKAALHAEQKENREREKADSKRFYNEDAPAKQLVFYSAGGGFFKYFKRYINYITANSDITVHYVTSDAKDKIFENENKQIAPYYIGEKALIPFMMKMDADMVIMTMPDLQQYHIKRSLVRKDVEYIYMDHGMTSFHLMLREGALDYYDTIFCCGPNHIDEVRETERLYELPKKNLVKVGYGLLDDMLEAYEAYTKEKVRSENDKKLILIAPSWQKDSIMELCLDEMLDQLVGKGYQVIVRPHPEFIKRFPEKMKRILDKYQDQLNEDFEIQTDFSSNFTVFASDLVITDWSSIAQEFSYCTKKPSLFVNTPMKIMNPEYKRIPLVPLDISLRDEIGVSIDVDKLDTLQAVVEDLFAHEEDYKTQIEQTIEKNIYNVGHSDQAAGEYVFAALEKAEKRRLAQEAEELA